MHGWQVWILAVLALIIFALTMLVSRRVWRRQRAESGVTDWARTARALSWRDRWRLGWATTTGQAVSDPRLAAHAARRGLATQEMIGRIAPRMKWAWIALGLIWLALGVQKLFLEGWSFWVILDLALGMTFAFMPQLVAWDARRARRSAEVNRRLVEERGTDPDTR
jgi:hypothetical protein